MPIFETEKEGKEKILRATIERQIHLFILRELDEQDLMRANKSRSKEYPQHLADTATTLIEIIRHAK